MQIKARNNNESTTDSEANCLGCTEMDLLRIKMEQNLVSIITNDKKKKKTKREKLTNTKRIKSSESSAVTTQSSLLFHCLFMLTKHTVGF